MIPKSVLLCSISYQMGKVQEQVKGMWAIQFNEMRKSDYVIDAKTCP